MSETQWPRIYDKGTHMMYSDPPRGIGISIEKSSTKSQYFFQLLMLQNARSGECELCHRALEFWHGKN